MNAIHGRKNSGTRGLVKRAVLQEAGREKEIKICQSAPFIADELGVAGEELERRDASGRRRPFLSQLRRAARRLVKAGLLRRLSHGRFAMTKLGRELTGLDFRAPPAAEAAH